jgi:deoxyribonuclease-4
MLNESRRLLGAHTSIAGGISRSIDRGLALGCTAIQIFTGFNNRWISQRISDEELHAFYEKKPLVRMIFAHNNYLINLASPDPVISSKSFRAMLEELQRAERLELPYLVIHPGSHVGCGEREGLQSIAARLNDLFSETKTFHVRILLETASGQGTSLGYRFEHLAGILDLIHYPERIGVCQDTCHCFAAGYDFRTPGAYEKTFREFDRLIGLHQIRAFHLNDSKRELGSRRDRHEHIGKGFLGLEAFRLLLHDKRFEGIPMVIETPKGKGLEEDRMNLEVVRSLLPRNILPAL